MKNASNVFVILDVSTPLLAPLQCVRGECFLDSDVVYLGIDIVKKIQDGYSCFRPLYDRYCTNYRTCPADEYKCDDKDVVEVDAERYCKGFFELCKVYVEYSICCNTKQKRNEKT